MTVEFEETTLRNATDHGLETRKGMAGWMIKNGIAKSESPANIILIATAIILFFIAFYLLKWNINNTSNLPSSPLTPFSERNP